MKFRKGQEVMVYNKTKEKVDYITVPRTGMCDITLKRWVVAIKELADPTDEVKFTKM